MRTTERERDVWAKQAFFFFVLLVCLFVYVGSLRFLRECFVPA